MVDLKRRIDSSPQVPTPKSPKWLRPILNCHGRFEMRRRHRHGDDLRRRRLLLLLLLGLSLSHETIDGSCHLNAFYIATIFGRQHGRRYSS